jgi:hypothetical protein
LQQHISYIHSSSLWIDNKNNNKKTNVNKMSFQNSVATDGMMPHHLTNELLIMEGSLANPNDDHINDEQQQSNNNLGLTFDQNQLLQITQLMNELQENSTSNTINYSNQNETTVLSSDGNTTSSNYHQQDNKMMMPQVHSIIINGQPALFIPTTDPNLLQHILTNNQNQQNPYNLIRNNQQQEQFNYNSFNNLPPPPPPPPSLSSFQQSDASLQMITNEIPIEIQRVASNF